jgi:RNA polymerase sigma-70 factor (ECF subfamily)
VDASEAVAEMKSGEKLDLESVFLAYYGRIARTIASVIHDQGRAEELAVEVFLKWAARQTWPANGTGRDSTSEGWLYRTAANLALDELRKQARRSRFDRLVEWVRKPPTPEEIHSAKQEQERVRTILGGMGARQAALLILRSQGLSYEELASALGLNPASVGTLLSRAQQIFRKEYVKKYGA